MNPASNNRRSVRVLGFDYTLSCPYFITIVTADRVNRFGQVTDSQMLLNPVGQMAQRELLRLPTRFPGLLLEDYVIMPNHVHGIIVLGGSQNSNPPEGQQVGPGSIGAVVRAYKSSTTLRFHQILGGVPGPLWQRSYYEHIVRGAKDYDLIRAYILNNPAKWEEDREFQEGYG